MKILLIDSWFAEYPKYKCIFNPCLAVQSCFHRIEGMPLGLCSDARDSQAIVLHNKVPAPSSNMDMSQQKYLCQWQGEMYLDRVVASMKGFHNEKHSFRGS